MYICTYIFIYTHPYIIIHLKRKVFLTIEEINENKQF